jgi:two-component system phosphate regulon response regulator PhoB
MMPGLDGYDLVDQLRRDEGLCDLPVIMVTARTADEDISKGFSSGTDIYIEKPFKPAELVAFVRRFVGPAKPDTSSPSL